jgi:DNA (cytosine-5)-methyltransferase 1
VKLNHLDLFSGIGGFSLGLERTGGFRTIGFCETDAYCTKVLQKNFPGIPIHGDIKKLKGTHFGAVDIITGGYPCQPFSVAGKQKGVEDPRHLWPEYFRIIKESRPAWVIGENVAGHIKLGLDSVIEDLESEGYAARTFSISASSVGANHQRERIWIVAHSERNGLLASEKQRSIEETISKQSKGKNNTLNVERTSSISETKSDVANAYGVNDAIGRVDRTIQETGGSGSIDERGGGTNANGFSHSSKNETLDSEILADTHSEGLERQWKSRNQFGSEFTATESGEERQGEMGQGWWQSEPNVGRVAHGIPHRVDRLKALGNSLVPNIPYYIGQSIIQTYDVEDTDTAGQQDRTE